MGESWTAAKVYCKNETNRWAITLTEPVDPNGTDVWPLQSGKMFCAIFLRISVRGRKCYTSALETLPFDSVVIVEQLLLW